MKRYFVLLAPTCFLLLLAFSTHAGWHFIHKYSSQEGATQVLIDYLKSHPQMIDSKDKDGKTALMWAAWNMQLSTVEALLARGAKVNAADLSGNSALILAAGPHAGEETIKVQIVSLLLAHGASPNQANSNGSTALHSAVQFGYAEVAKVLLAGGANAGSPNKENTTPCSIARRDRPEMLSFLECPHCQRPVEPITSQSQDRTNKTASR